MREAIDALWRIGDHDAFELLLEDLLSEKVDHPSEAQRVVEILHPASAHFVQDVVNFAQPKCKVALHVIAIRPQLQVDGLHQRQITCQECESFVSRHGVGARYALGDAQRGGQLQQQATPLVESRSDEVLQYLE